jgi:hypothetical protein
MYVGVSQAYLAFMSLRTMLGIPGSVIGRKVLRGSKALGVHYPNRLGQLPSEGNFFGVAELIDNEDNKREPTQRDVLYYVLIEQ